MSKDEEKYIRDLINRDNLITETVGLLEDCLTAFSEIPRKKLYRVDLDTYEIASRLSEILKKWKQ